MSKIANVSAPIESREENSAIPETVNRRVGPREATWIVSPGAKPSFSAVPASIATSREPDGQRPAVSRSGLKRGDLKSMPRPSAASLSEMGFP